MVRRVLLCTSRRVVLKMAVANKCEDFNAVHIIVARRDIHFSAVVNSNAA